MTLKHLEPHQVPKTGERSLVFHEDGTIVICNIDDQLHAIKDECPHAGAALCSGRLAGHLIQCPAHGLRFDLRSGAMPGNADLRVRVYPIRKHGDVYALDLAPQDTPQHIN